MQQDHVILGVHIQNRIKAASTVQSLLGKYGCNIRTRLGLHDTNDKFCSSAGVILLEIVGDPAQSAELESKLSELQGVAVKKMVFGHE